MALREIFWEVLRFAFNKLSQRGYGMKIRGYKVVDAKLHGVKTCKVSYQIHH